MIRTSMWTSIIVLLAGVTTVGYCQGLEKNWNDFVHFAAIGNFDLAKGYAQAVIDSSHQVSQLLRNLDHTVQQVNQGQSTAAKMLHDPDLYEEMLSSTQNLNQAVQELRVLLGKWSREGMKVKW